MYPCLIYGGKGRWAANVGFMDWSRNTNNGWRPFIFFLLMLAACRIEPEATQWVETHGEWSFQSIAAWPEGAWAVGMDDRVFRYPGEWGSPWNRPLAITGKQVVASPNFAYVLGADGTLRRAAGAEVFSYEQSAQWQIKAMAAGQDDSLFVISNGQVKRVTDRLQDAACNEEAVSIAVGRTGLQFVTKEGTLRRQQSDGSCTNVALPQGALARQVAAHGTRLAFVSQEGRGFLRNADGEAWIPLPRPRTFRSDHLVSSRAIRDISLSELYMWALDTGGRAFLLSEAQ